MTIVLLIRTFINARASTQNTCDRQYKLIYLWECNAASQFNDLEGQTTLFNWKISQQVVSRCRDHHSKRIGKSETVVMTAHHALEMHDQLVDNN